MERERERDRERERERERERFAGTSRTHLIFNSLWNALISAEKNVTIEKMTDTLLLVTVDMAAAEAFCAHIYDLIHLDEHAQAGPCLQSPSASAVISAQPSKEDAGTSAILARP